MRNSLLIGLMPTASTSILLGVNETMEPFNSNIFVRSTGTGEFLLVNKHLVRDLEELGLWNESLRKKIIADGGSVQDTGLPQDLKDRYKTIWEIPMRHIIDMAADRQEFIDQSQSMNLYFTIPDYTKISGALKYGWERGLKTGCYYLRTTKQVNKPKRLNSIECENDICTNCVI